MTAKEKWLKQPDSQGWWWHWDECPEHAPFIYSILTSLSRKINREFIASPDSRWCVDVGGLWMKVEEPSIEAAWQNAAESLPAQPEQDDPLGIKAALRMTKGHLELSKPVAPVEAQEKDQCGANLGMYECRLDYGHPNDHDDQGVKWLNSFNVAEPKPTPSTPDEPHKNGWHYGYITCSCGWAWDSRNTLTGSLATQHGLRIFEKHKAEVSKPQPDSSSIPDGPTCSCGHPKAFHYEDMRGKQCSYGDHTICPCKGFNAAAPSPLLHDGVVEVWTKARNPEHQVCQSMAIELQAWRKWAKGHSNGR